MRKQKRGLALLLSMVIVMTSILPANMAEAVSSESTVALKEEKIVNEILKKEELKEERTEYSTTYEMPDGTTQVENYALPIRYRDQKTKELVDYDASLMGIHTSDRLASGNKLTGYQYQNKSGDKKNYFPETLNKDTPIITEYDGYQISIHDENGADTQGVADEKKEITDLYGEEKKVLDSMTYYDVHKDVNSQWESLENGIKENVILEEPGEINRFSYRLKLTDCYPELVEIEEEGKKSTSILIKDNKTEEEVAFIPAAFMNDASEDGAYSEDCYYQLKKINENEYRITLVVSKDYLQASERVYPVTIDPTITWNDANSVHAVQVRGGSMKENDDSLFFHTQSL